MTGFAGPPCRECDSPIYEIGADAPGWAHYDHARDYDHEADPCVCERQNGIVAERNPWCPLHGCEDALSGALWVNPKTARALSNALASTVER